MAEVNFISMRLIGIVVAAIAIQGCATTEELFAEYDSEFCVGESAHSSVTDPTAMSCPSSVAKSHLSTESIVKAPGSANTEAEVKAAKAEAKSEIIAAKSAAKADIEAANAEAISEVKVAKARAKAAETEIKVAKAEARAEIKAAKAKAKAEAKTAKSKEITELKAGTTAKAEAIDKAAKVSGLVGRKIDKNQAIVYSVNEAVRAVTDDSQIVEVPASLSQLMDANRTQSARVPRSTGDERLTVDLGVSSDGSTNAERLTINLGVLGEGSTRVKRLIIDLGVSGDGSTRPERVTVDLDEGGYVTNGVELQGIGTIGSEAQQQ